MFAVGNIVIDNDNRMGFIEEIIIDPNPNGMIIPHREGKFSLYSLNHDEYKNGSRFYIGDTMGYNMRATGKNVTKEDLEEIMNLVPENKGIARDFPIVIKNLGRTKGRND